MIESIRTKFDEVFIDQAACESSVAKRAQVIFDSSKIKIVDEIPRRHGSGALSSREFSQSKRRLFITPFQGQFFKRCPGAKPSLTCCNYFILNLGLQCDMNCSYCYLQSYINTPMLTIYSNLDSALHELREMFNHNPDSQIRIGTGETMDSLSLDPLTLYSRELIEFFKSTPKWSLEFKTKSDYIEQFIDMEHAGNIIVSWSVNPTKIVEYEEHGTASLDRRLQAARRCADRGFKIAFHMDPMIWHPDWEQSYDGLTDQIASMFSPDEVTYISLGALRFQPEQRLTMRERFGFQSLVNQGELFPSKDGKWRYDRNLRNRMFRRVIERFHARSPDWKVFLCMETPESWLGTFDTTPMQVAGLKPLFQQDAKLMV